MIFCYFAQKSGSAYNEAAPDIIFCNNYESAVSWSSTSCTSISTTSAISSLLVAHSTPWNAALRPIWLPPSVVREATSVETPVARSTTGYFRASSFISLLIAISSSDHWKSSFAFLSAMAMASSLVFARRVHSEKRATPSGLAAPLHITQPSRVAA